MPFLEIRADRRQTFLLPSVKDSVIYVGGALKNLDRVQLWFVSLCLPLKILGEISKYSKNIHAIVPKFCTQISASNKVLFFLNFVREANGRGVNKCWCYFFCVRSLRSAIASTGIYVAVQFLYFEALQ